MTDREGELAQAAQVRAVLDANPDLLVMLLTPDGGGECGTCYHRGVSARVESILMPRAVERELGSTCGLDEGRYYTDGDDAAEAVSEWLFEGWWGAALDHSGRALCLPTERPGASMGDALTDCCGACRGACRHGLADMADRLAVAMVAEMPWREYVVVSAAL